MRIVLMGGGTAGHLFPSVAVAQRLLDRPGTELLFVGAEGRLDGRILSEAGFPHQLIPARPFPYGISPSLIPAMWALYKSYCRCLSTFRNFRPRAVFSAGGYVSVAGVLAARRMGIPTVCHASDAHPDRANRLVAPWATRVTTAYEAAASAFPADRTIVVGQPVRKEFLQADRRRCREALGIAEGELVLLVSGGSQGARRLNEAVIGALPRLLDCAHVIHLTGTLEHVGVARQAAEQVGKSPRYRCLAFSDRPWELAAAADLALTRGGASSLAELAVLGVPMIIVPYPGAAAHQKQNAAPLVEAGAAVLVDNEKLTSDLLALQVAEMAQQSEKLRAMAEAARRWSRPRAADTIAELLVTLAQS